MRTNFRQRPEWQWGELGARKARRWFNEQGWFVVPTDAIEEGGAPALIGLLERHVLPDMQVARNGEVRWVEVKTKDSPVEYRKAGRWRQGIDLPNWRAYLEVERITGIPGWLAIFQFKPGPRANPDPKLLLAAFADLRRYGQEVEPPGAGRKFPHGAVFWDEDRFDRFPMDFDASEAPDLTPLRTVVHPWEAKSATGVAPQTGPKQEVMPW